MTHLFKEGFSYKLGFEAVAFQGFLNMFAAHTKWSSFRLTMTGGSKLAGSQIRPHFPLPSISVGDEDRANLHEDGGYCSNLHYDATDYIFVIIVLWPLPIVSLPLPGRYLQFLYSYKYPHISSIRPFTSISSACMLANTLASKLCAHQAKTPNLLIHL